MPTPEVQQLIESAADHVRKQEFDQAADQARHAIDQDPRSSDAYGILGIAMARTGRIDEATEAFQRAVQTAPYSARSYYNLAMHYYGMGNKADAISMCQEAIRCDGKHRGATELLKKLESETHVQIAPYQTSLGDARGTAYTYKKEEPDEPPPF
ncbi:MAG TPA: tetratricopeptide repeat protein [Fimbriimonadales bacterium]|jgi:Flp pilus assembly protein TadD|nr:tetratricopeptide repeat protein [Fimbriimonadales bacterium]